MNEQAKRLYDTYNKALIELKNIYGDLAYSMFNVNEQQVQELDLSPKFFKERLVVMNIFPDIVRTNHTYLLSRKEQRINTVVE